jgi:hypothetical protein
MNIPQTWSAGSMGITQSVASVVVGAPATQEEKIIKKKVKSIEKQAEQIADSYMKWDNQTVGSFGDLNPEDGKVVMIQQRPFEPVLSAVVEYNTETGNPASMDINTMDGRYQSHTVWDENGKIVTKEEVRNLGTHVESVSIIRDEKSDAVFYQQKIESVPAIQQTSYQAPHQAAYPSTYQTPYQSQYTSPYQSPYTTPYQSGYQTPYYSAYPTAGRGYYNSMYQSPYYSPYQSSYRSPYYSSYQTPGRSYYESPNYSSYSQSPYSSYSPYQSSSYSSMYRNPYSRLLGYPGSSSHPMEPTYPSSRTYMNRGYY